MDILNDLDLKGNQILNGFLQGTAQKVSKPLKITLKGSKTTSEEYDGSKDTEVIVSAQSIGSIDRVQMDSGEELKINQGLLTIPTVRGLQGIRGPQGVQGVQGLKGRLDEAFYSNSDPMPQSLGGLSEGTVFNQMPYDELLSRLLYPYTKPLISLTSDYRTGVFEFGEVYRNILLTASVTKKSERLISTKISDSLKGVLIENTTLQTSGKVTYTVPVIDKTVTFTATVQDAVESIVTSNQLKYQFVYPVYHGVMDDIPTGDTVKSLTKKVVTKSTITEKLSSAISNKRFVIACPPGWELSKIEDGNGFDNTSAFTKIIRNVVGMDGSEQSYTIYYSERTSQPANFIMKYLV